jgi:hypothetical protein
MNEISQHTWPWDISAERKSWSRVLTACALSRFPSANQRLPRQLLKAHWPDDARAMTLMKAAQSPTDTTNSGLPAVAPTVTWRSLAPGAAAWKLFDHPSALRLDLSDLQTLSMANIAGLPPVPMFVDEADPAPVMQWTWSKTTLGPTKKILAVAVVTDELERATPESAAAIMGRVLSDASQKSIDTIAFDATAGSDIRPAGLLNGVAAISPSTATDHIIAMAEDISNLVGKIGEKGIDPSDTVFIASPAEAMMLTLLAGAKFNNDVLMSLGIPPKIVIAVSPTGIASGYQGPPQIETSKETSLHMNTVPGEPTQPPSTSLFQTQRIAIKVRAQAAWCAAPGAVQYVQNVLW